MLRDTHRIIVCPFWARFFQRPDGYWIAYCSHAACVEMEEKRPGFLANQDFERSRTCLLGYSMEAAVVAPIIVKGVRDTSYSNYGMSSVSDDQWDKLVTEFIDWDPSNDWEPRDWY